MPPTTAPRTASRNNQLRKRLAALQMENAAYVFHVLAPLIKAEHMNVFAGRHNNPRPHMTVTRANRIATYNKLRKLRGKIGVIKRQLGIK
jgi:hypothetical protein